MDVEPHKDFAAIQEAMAGWAQRESPWSGEIFRSATFRYARAGDMVTGLGSAMDRVRSEDWRALQRTGREATSQAIGRAAFEAGLEGILVPSVTSPGNAVSAPDRPHHPIA